MGNKTTALTPAEVLAIDWKNEATPGKHSVQVCITPTVVRERYTGEVIAIIVNPKYHFFWNHLHTHFARHGECGLTKGKENKSCLT